MSKDGGKGFAQMAQAMGMGQGGGGMPPGVRHAGACDGRRPWAAST